MERDRANPTPTPGLEGKEDYSVLIGSNDKEKQEEGFIKLRELLSEDSKDLIDKIVKSNLMERIFELLETDSEEQFKIELFGVVSQIFKSKHLKGEQNPPRDFQEKIISLLDSKSENLLAAVLRLISSILPKSPEFKGFCLIQDTLSTILEIHQKWSDNLAVKGCAVMAMSAIIGKKPVPDWEMIYGAMKVINKTLLEVPVPEVFESAAEALINVSDKYIQQVIDLGCIPALVHLLTENEISRFRPAMMCLGNILTGNPEEAREVLQHPQFLPRIFELISDPREEVQKEACWIVSNVAADDPKFTKQILAEPHYVELIKKALFTGSPKVKVEASWCITNLVSLANSDQLVRFVNQFELFKCLGEILNNEKNNIIDIGLEAAVRVLMHTSQEKDDSISNRFKEEGLLSKVQELKGKKAPKLKKRIQQIEDFFYGENEKVGNVKTKGGIGFGAPAAEKEDYDEEEDVYEEGDEDEYDGEEEEGGEGGQFNF